MSAILPAAERPVIVCVGDSITFGDKLAKPKVEAYPRALERLFAGKATVVNAGHCGAAAMKAADIPYWTTPEFTAASAAAPQVVVIMLGTNDSRTPNWNAHQATYATDLAALVDVFKRLPSKPLVWLCLPPPAYNARWGIQPAVIHDQLLPQIAAVAKQAGVRTIDVSTALSGHAELFTDGIHPNAAGAELLARTVYAALTSTAGK